MDSYREHPSDFDLPVSESTSAERRGGGDRHRRAPHARSRLQLLGVAARRPRLPVDRRSSSPATSRISPPIACCSISPAARDNPAIPYIGADIRDECGLTDDTRTISDVPPRSLLSRLTDHYMQIIANRAPIGFEAEFVNQREENICYRGILMPFSSDGEAIDFIYGVINWKTVEEASLPGTVAPTAIEDEPQPIEDMPELILGQAVETEIEESVAIEAESVEFEDHPAWEDGPSGDPKAAPVGSAEEQAPQPPAHFAWQDGPLSEEDSDEAVEVGARRECRSCRPSVGCARDRGIGQGWRGPYARFALSRFVAGI